MVDIHDYNLKFAQAEAQVRQSTISEKNKNLIFAYRDACLLQQVCKKVRLIRVFGVLVLFARHMNKDFDTLTKEDIQAALGKLVARQPQYSPETLGTYKAIIKRFMTFVSQPGDFPKCPPPPLVSWITGHVKRNEKKKLDRNDLLTPGDIEAVLRATHNIRDKALISMLWETGGRIAEIGNLQLKHVTKTQFGYQLDVNGKTGRRSPLIVSSAPYLSQWLANHPAHDDPESPLWVHYQYHAQPGHLHYDTIKHLLTNAFARAGVKKRIYPHLFRHSRATYVLANGVMTEAQAKVFFGWSPASEQLATYAHLVDADANNAILRENNLAPVKQQHDELLPITCRICQEVNPPNADYCTKCNAVLDLKKAYEHQTLGDLRDTLFAKMFKLLVERGMIDEAAREIHDAGLGSTLKRLAQHATGERNITDSHIIDTRPVNQKAALLVNQNGTP